jgi:signal peptidase II
LESAPPTAHPTTTKAHTVRRWAALLVSAAAVFTLDQLAKAWVMATIAPGETIAPIPAIADFVAITRSANRGAAFSLLPQAGDLFLIIALAMIVGIVLFYRKMPGSRWIERIALGLLLGGVASNALDRIRLGYVVDYVHLQLRPLISNVSNFADHAIVLGIAILFVVQWRTEKKAAGRPEIHAETPTEDTPPPTP